MKPGWLYQDDAHWTTICLIKMDCTRLHIENSSTLSLHLFILLPLSFLIKTSACTEVLRRPLRQESSIFSSCWHLIINHFPLPQHLSLKYWLAKRQAEGPAFGYNTRTHGKRGRGGREEDITQAHTQGAAGVGPGEVTACEGGPGKAEVPTSPWVLQLNKQTGWEDKGHLSPSSASPGKCWKAYLGGSWEKREETNLWSQYCALWTVPGSVNTGEVGRWVLHGPFVGGHPSDTSLGPLCPNSPGPLSFAGEFHLPFPAKLSMELCWSLSCSFLLPMPLPQGLASDH